MPSPPRAVVLTTGRGGGRGRSTSNDHISQYIMTEVAHDLLNRRYLSPLSNAIKFASFRVWSQQNFEDPYCQLVKKFREAEFWDPIPTDPFYKT
uniref:Uncharacterized protein n=1 Tax=Solanum tuberosum TaxID=4113 RepID=M1DL17_SOLTU